MPYDLVKKPVSGPRAFQKTDAQAAQSQAAILLLLGRQLRGDDSALVARATNTRSAKMMKALVEEDEAEFPVPKLRATNARISAADTRGALAKRYGAKAVRYVYGKDDPEQWTKAYADLGDQCYKTPTVETAAELMEMCLGHPDELTRVASASAYFSLSPEPQKLIKILAAGARSNEPLVRNVSATTLARVAPDNASLRRLTKGKQPKANLEPAHTSLLVHGTFAASSTWWQPGGDFHTYFRTQVRNDLYNGADRFGWSGGYSDAARAQAANDLVAWVNGHNVQGLDLLGHSHGANAMLLATHSGLRAGKLILLSCPVHVHKYMPDFANVNQVISIRVKHDLVILADLGGQKFTHPQIRENVLPIWFNHSATHDPAVWQNNNIPNKI
ncbi:MAG: alpha/beta fold hydrolase [Blastocatellia bacterium]